MDDLKQFYTRLLRIERPWIVLEVRFQDQERVDVYVDHERGIKMITPPSGSGGTWTRAICPPTSIPACPGSSAGSTGCSPSPRRGPSPARA